MKYKIILILVGISLVTSVVIGVSYAIWLLTETQTEDNVVEAGCFDISFTENTDAISLLNSYPVPDATGSQNEPFNFTVTNTCDLDAYYDINVEVLNTTTLDASLIKVRLDDDVPLLVTDGESKLATISGATSYKIGEGFLEAGISSTHDFRMWMDINATLDNSQNAVIYTKIVINASPIDTDIIDTTVCLEDYRNRNLTPNPISDFTYTETDTEITITDYTGTESDVVIPCEINYKPVKVIGERSFEQNSITSVVFPLGLRTIEDSAFYANYLSNLVLPEGVETIGDSSFAGVLGYSSRIRYISFPDSLEHIGDGAFYRNVSLQSLIIPDGVKTIGGGAFREGGIINLTLGKNLTSIGNYAFFENDINSLILPDNVSIIGAYAFQRNNITSLTIGEKTLEIGVSAFSQNSSLTELTIPKNVIRIGQYAFEQCPLTTINVEGKSGPEDFVLLGTPWYHGTPTINWIP